MSTQTTQTQKKSKKMPPNPPVQAKPKPLINKATLAKSAEGYPLLGTCAYWTMTNVNLTYTAFLKLLEESGIDPDYAGTVRSKSALIRALQKETATRKNSFYRKVVDDKEHAVFVIVAQSVDAKDVKVNFNTDTQVIFEKETGKIKVDGYNKEALIQFYNDEQGMYNVDNLRTVVLSYLYGECEAISVRDNGGIYFVPSNRFSEFARLEVLFQKFPGCSLNVLPVIDTAQAKKSMWQSLIGEIEMDLARQKERLEKSPPTTEKGRESHIRTFQGLKSKVEMYEDLLTHTASGLKRELESLSSLLASQLA